MRLPDGPLTTYRADDGSIGIAALDGASLDEAMLPAPAAKAVSLTVGTRQRPQGFWLGDPIAGGSWVDTGSGGLWGAGWREGGAFDYRRAVGDGLGNSIVAGCLRAITEAVGEPPPKLYTLDGKDERQPSKEPLALLRLLRRPNPYLTWKRAAVYIALAQHAAGAAYFWKARSGAGRVVALWPLPPDRRSIWPIEGASTSEYLTGFGYKPEGQETPITLPPEDVLYLPYSNEPLNPRRPRSPLESIYKQIFTDEEAADFTASVLRNFGVPGVVLSPDPGAVPNGGGGPDQAAREQIKQTYKQKFGGASRGEPMVLTGPMRVSVVSYSPEQMRLDRLQMVPESRICAALGVPPIVALLLSGLEMATYCLPAAARVWTPAGAVPIAAVVPGQIVWSFVDGRIEPRRVVRAGKTGHKALYEIKTKNRTLRATGNHPVLVRTAGRAGGGPRSGRTPVGVTWKRVDELTTADYVVQPKALPDQGGHTLSDGSEATPEMMQFLGALLGDGTVERGTIRMAIPTADRCAKVYRELAQALFTKQAHASGGNPTAQSQIARVPIVVQEQPRSFRFASRVAAALLTSAAWGFAGRAATKRVPAWVYALARPLRLAFLAGVVDSDGSVSKLGQLTVGFANEALTHDVRDLLISVGIQCCNVRYQQQRASGLPQPGRQDTYDFWTFTASSAAQVAAIPFSDPVYRERVEAHRHRLGRDGTWGRPRGGLDETLGFYRIHSIQSLPAEDVYDIEVEDGHSFIADGVVVHNSNAKQMREQFIEQKMVPYWSVLEEDLTWDLLPEFGGDPTQAGITLDLQDVRALQEDQDTRYKRVSDMASRGGLLVDEWRKELGFPPLPGGQGQVLYVPTTSTPTKPEDLLPKPEPAAASASVGDGTAPPPPPNGTNGQARLEDLQRLPAVVANGTNGMNGRAQ
jgi:phage portal protein BeeE